MSVSPMQWGGWQVLFGHSRHSSALADGDTMDVQTVSGLVTQGDTSTFVIAD